MQRYQDSIILSTGQAVVGASVQVLTYPAGAVATIYSDNGSTTTTNPLITDGNGHFAFYAADARYSLVITKVGIAPITVSDILLEDPADGSAALSASGGAALVGFLPSGTTPIATTVSEVLLRRKNVFDWFTAAQKVDVLARTALVDVTAACQAAIDWCYDNAYGLDWPDGTYWITKSLLVWGGTSTYTEKSSSLVGNSPTGAIMKKTTNTGYGGVSAYASDDAIFVAARRDLTAGNSVALKNIRIANFTLNGDFGSGKTAFGIYNRCSLGASTFDSLVVSAAIGFQSLTDLFLSRITNTTFIVSTKGFSMLAAGTSNFLSNVYVSGATSIAYELRGAYSSGHSLACDNCTGVCYSFNAGSWTVNGLGSESTSASVVVQTANGSWVVLNGPYILPQNNVADKVFNILGTDAVIVNGGRVGSGSSPQALAGQLAAVAAGAKFKMNDLTISDTYAVASTGPYLRSAGSTKSGALSVANATATTLYSLTGEEAGLFLAYGTGDNAGIYSLAYIGAAGNVGFAVISSASLTLTNVAGAIKVQHALGAPYTVGWHFLRFGDAVPLSL